MSKLGMLAAVALAAASETDAPEKQAETPPACSCDPNDPNYSPDCVCEDASAEDTTAKTEQAVKAERSRILGIAAAAFPGQEKLALDLINRGTSLGDAALAFNADQKSKASRVMNHLDADEKAVSGLRSEPANATAPANPLAGLSGEALWKAEFSQNADLQAEFAGNEKAYLAFRKADAEGRARILNKASA